MSTGEQRPEISRSDILKQLDASRFLIKRGDFFFNLNCRCLQDGYSISFRNFHNASRVHSALEDSLVIELKQDMFVMVP